MVKEEDELNKAVATYCYSSGRIEIHRSFAAQHIYLHTTWNEQDDEWNIEHLPDFTKDMNAHIERLFPALTARCYDPEIGYDHEMDQWVIILRNWTSGCSKDSPVGYCKEAEQIPYTICKCIKELA